MSWFELRKVASIEPQRTQRDEIAVAYQIVLSTPSGQAVLNDLVQFSQNCESDSRARGRCDVVTRMLEMREKAIERTTEETE